MSHGGGKVLPASASLWWGINRVRRGKTGLTQSYTIWILCYGEEAGADVLMRSMHAHYCKWRRTQTSNRWRQSWNMKWENEGYWKRWTLFLNHLPYNVKLFCLCNRPVVYQEKTYYMCLLLLHISMLAMSQRAWKQLTDTTMCAVWSDLRRWLSPLV